MLKDFAFFPPNIFSKIEELYKLIDKDNEDWGRAYHNNTHPILLNYLNHTYSKIVEENKLVITSDSTKCCFNTGLLTPYPYYEPVYALFYRNKNEHAKSEWVSAGFCQESTGYLREYCDGIFPKRAEYFDDPSKLIFNPMKKITVNTHHIIEDNKERLAELFDGMNAEKIHQTLDWVIKIINKRIITDYKLAVPQYYKGKIQLLLPLHIIEGAEKPQLALVIEEHQTDYVASTCLTIGMAYNNARLIAKPYSGWLKP